MNEINTLQDPRSERILEAIKEYPELTHFFISLSKVIDEYLSYVYALDETSDSDIEDEPSEPYDGLETEDDY
jgi:hypothetical protein